MLRDVKTWRDAVADIAPHTSPRFVARSRCCPRCAPGRPTARAAPAARPLSPALSARPSAAQSLPATSPPAARRPPAPCDSTRTPCARKAFGWPERCELARALLWAYSCKRLKLAQLLGRHGVLLTLPCFSQADQRRNDWRACLSRSHLTSLYSGWASAKGRQVGPEDAG